MSRPPAKTTDIDPRVIAADFFRKLGGMEGMTKWGKTHRSLAYQLISKLMAQPSSTTFIKNTVNASLNVDGEAARAKLEDAFLRLIAARILRSISSNSADSNWRRSSARSCSKDRSRQVRRLTTWSEFFEISELMKLAL